MTIAAGRAFSVIGAGCGHGASDRGCALGPQALRALGLPERLRRHAPDTVWIEMTAPEGDPLAVISRMDRHLAHAVENARRHHRFPVVLGGDHSCAVGTWRGIGRSRDGKPFRLIWIDAHMDMHTPESSHSGALHGMPLACLLGHGPALWHGRRAALRPDQVTLIGVRSWEHEEETLAKALGIRVVFMVELLLRRHLKAILAELAKDGPFGITLDLDAIDPVDAPGVGTPVENGIRGAELLDALRPLLASPHCLGLEIAEFNPLRDHNHRTAALVESLILAAMVPGEPP